MTYYKTCEQKPPHRIDSWDDVLGSCGARAKGHECEWLGPDVFLVPVAEGAIERMLAEEDRLIDEPVRLDRYEWMEALLRAALGGERYVP